jgi:hypothetical protein
MWSLLCVALGCFWLNPTLIYIYIYIYIYMYNDNREEKQFHLKGGLLLSSVPQTTRRSTVGLESSYTRSPRSMASGDDDQVTWVRRRPGERNH